MTGADDLAAELGGPPPEEFGTLRPEDAADLAAALRAARAARRQALEDAADRALRAAPTGVRERAKARWVR